jgi:hypothetical protein
MTRQIRPESCDKGIAGVFPGTNWLAKNIPKMHIRAFIVPILHEVEAQFWIIFAGSTAQLHFAK